MHRHEVPGPTFKSYSGFRGLLLTPAHEAKDKTVGPRNPSVYSLFLLLFFLLKGKKRKDGPEDVEIKSEI